MGRSTRARDAGEADSVALTVEELSTLSEFRALKANGSGVFVIVDRPSGRCLVHDATCPFVNEESFAAKAAKAWRHGRYCWMADADEAIERFGAVRCKHPADPI